jgi:hypothetical protein
VEALFVFGQGRNHAAPGNHPQIGWDCRGLLGVASYWLRRGFLLFACPSTCFYNLPIIVAASPGRVSLWKAIWASTGLALEGLSRYPS